MAQIGEERLVLHICSFHTSHHPSCLVVWSLSRKKNDLVFLKNLSSQIAMKNGGGGGLITNLLMCCLKFFFPTKLLR